jgi:RNA polymerase sigma factor (TIGR02999 family)
MGTSSHQGITQLLQAWGGGDQAALERLTPLIYEELHRLARHYMAQERSDHVLQTTALVNEAYIRLLNWKEVSWRNRAHFFGVSARLMRHILVDFARRRPLYLPSHEVRQVPLEEALAVTRESRADLVAMDEALKILAELDPRKGKIVELRFFGGRTVEETAEIMKVSPMTVKREWNKARAWLLRELSRDKRDEA